MIKKIFCTYLPWALLLTSLPSEALQVPDINFGRTRSGRIRRQVRNATNTDSNSGTSTSTSANSNSNSNANSNSTSNDGIGEVDVVAEDSQPAAAVATGASPPAANVSGNTVCRPIEKSGFYLNGPDPLNVAARALQSSPMKLPSGNPGQNSVFACNQYFSGSASNEILGNLTFQCKGNTWELTGNDCVNRLNQKCSAQTLSPPAVAGGTTASVANVGESNEGASVSLACSTFISARGTVSGSFTYQCAAKSWQLTGNGCSVTPPKGCGTLAPGTYATGPMITYWTGTADPATCSALCDSVGAGGCTHMTYFGFCVAYGAGSTTIPYAFGYGYGVLGTKGDSMYTGAVCQ